MKTKNQLALAPWVFTIGFFVLWEIVCRGLNVSSFILPAPSTILHAVWEYRSQLAYHAMHTLWMTLAGFGLAVGFGLLLGMVLGSSRLINAGSYPLLVGFNSIPKVAVVPILVFWFGVGWVPPVMTAFLISFFPIVVSTVVGLKSVETDMIDLVRSMGARTLKIMLRVRGPSALPQMFAGFKIAVCLAVVGAIVGEFVGSDRGLGYLLLTSTGTLDGSLVWSALFVLIAMGMTLFAIVSKLERLAIPWHVSVRVEDVAAHQS